MSSDARKDLSVLRRVTAELSDGRALEDALTVITDAALELVPGDHSSIRLLDASRTQLLASARSGQGKERRALRLGKSEGLAGWVCEHGLPALVLNAREDARYVEAVGQGFKIGSMVVEPLLAVGKAIGVLSISSREIEAFTEEDELLARLLANCSVPLIERARLERLAATDDLTLAFNRRYMTPRLEEEIERARRGAASVTVLALDLDHFKRTNDTYGHAVGDRVLCIFADRIRFNTRRFDVLVRSGGEEFVIIMPATPRAEAEDIAERLRSCIADEAMEPLPGAFITQTVSIGVAAWDGHESAEHLLRRADRALYDAKDAGRNRVATSADGTTPPLQSAG